MTINNRDSQSPQHKKEISSLNGLFCVRWRMPFIRLRLQQQTWLSKS